MPTTRGETPALRALQAEAAELRKVATRRAKERAAREAGLEPLAVKLLQNPQLVPDSEAAAFLDHLRQQVAALLRAALRGEYRHDVFPALRDAVERLKPAHTAFRLCSLASGLRVGRGLGESRGRHAGVCRHPGRTGAG